MPDYSVIYPDSNSLIKEGWPNVSTTLGNLLNLVGRMKLRFVFFDSVEQELEAHYLREFEERKRKQKPKPKSWRDWSRVWDSELTLSFERLERQSIL